MSDFSTPEWMRAVRDSKLPSTVKLVGVMLASYRNPRTNRAWPSRAELADACSLSDRAIDSAAARLIEHGWIAVTKTKGRGNRYSFGLGTSEARSLVLAKQLRQSLANEVRLPANELRGTSERASPEGVKEVTQEGVKTGRPSSEENQELELDPNSFFGRIAAESILKTIDGKDPA